MTFIWLLPVIVSVGLTSAHFLRMGLLQVAALALLLPFLLILRRAWVARLMQAVLVLASIEWLRTLVIIAQARFANGAPWARMALILGMVTVVTFASAFLFQGQFLRRRYRLD